MIRLLTLCALGAALALSACASAPEVRPTVSERQLEPREVAPGDSIRVSFNLETSAPEAIRRIHIRGLPKNTVLAGTKAEFPPPSGPKTPYASDIEIRIPAADGQYNLELVLETTGKTYVAPLGYLAILDAPSRVVYSQFLPGSHASSKCDLGTKLLQLEYAVEDDNGAADFVAPTLFAESDNAKGFVFFPHWKPVTWLDGADGIALKLPDSETEKKQLVTSDIRINCKMPPSTLYEYVIKGQSVSRLTGESKTSRSVPARYFVE